MSTQAPIIADNTEIQLELERILHSSVFRNALRSQRFLRYLVAAATAQPPIPVKEYTVAMDVFERSPNYDPAVDATVRVEAGRLRTRLRDFYIGEGRDDLLIIDVPKGSYAAAVSRHPAPTSKPLPEPAPELLQDPDPHPRLPNRTFPVDSSNQHPLRAPRFHDSFTVLMVAYRFGFPSLTTAPSPSW